MREEKAKQQLRHAVEEGGGAVELAAIDEENGSASFRSSTSHSNLLEGAELGGVEVTVDASPSHEGDYGRVGGGDSRV